MTFLTFFFDDNSYLYIYFSILFLPRPKVGFKKIYRCSFEPGVIFENQKLREIFVSEATESCKGSKWGFFGVPNTTRPFPGGLHVYFMCLHVPPWYQAKWSYKDMWKTGEIHMSSTWKWSRCAGHPQKPPFWPLTWLCSFVFQGFKEEALNASPHLNCMNLYPIS